MKKYSEEVERIFDRARALNQSGESDAALELIEESLDEHPDEWLLWSMRGWLYRCRKRYQEAIDSFSAAIEQYPNAGTALFFRGTCHARMGHLELAQADLERSLELLPDEADAYWWLGTVYEVLGQRENAIVANEKAFALNPSAYPGLPDYIEELRAESDLEEMLRGT